MSLRPIVAPQKHTARPSAACVGSLRPAAHMACFQAWKARSRRYSSKSASVRLARKTRHAAPKARRAWSKVTGQAASMLRQIATGIEAARPLPAGCAVGIVDALRDRADPHITITDQPGLLLGAQVAAAGKLRHRTSIS